MPIMKLHNLISNITTTLRAAIEICEKASDAQSLPLSIQTLCSQLPWIMGAFDKAKEGFPWSIEPSPDTLALKGILKDCANKSSSLEACLRAIIPRADSSTFERYRRSLGLIPTEDKVVMLKDGLFSDLKALAANSAVEAETQDNVRSLVGFVTREPGYNLWGVSDSD
ncbi:unnamed protein product [Fusarium venenatum]|uniref:NACHT-NTPase and P-loop NTPases N-terminal domain-containing protein n=1 Tax=Fusarium venenatum TaxID=56646 RepID=A0A2L2TZA5_9HYPO|nr:uncharacterized protein FVRRES_04212 [Fusarium venenatum]KAH7002833.1 hypothetical protein EDB82DRAFT_482085 [Fusarium venenatum]CEI67700.1 unnamed protein product [Fusarium venenatum]